MIKRLFFILMAMCVAVSGFALEVGEYVYTPQGRFQITGNNLNANSAFADFSGWTLVSAIEGKTLDQTVSINTGGFAEGVNSVSFIDATEGEGMSFSLKDIVSDAGKTYVVSYKLKGATTVSVRVKTVAVKTNLVQLSGEEAAAEPDGDPVVTVVNTAENLSDDWQTFNYAIVGDGTSRVYTLSLTGMAANVEVADLQIAPAQQVADLRQRDAMLEKLNVYKNCYEWNQSLLDDYAIYEIIEMLNGIGDNSSQDELDEYLGYSTEILDEFLKQNMDDYLAGGTKEYNYLGIGVDRMQKVSTIGIWNCLPVGRGFWTVGDYVDLGHYQSSYLWNNGAIDDPMGVYTQMSLNPGSFVFAIEGLAAFREPQKSNWNIDQGMKPAYGVSYIVKIVEGAEPDTIASVVKGLEPVNYTPFYVPVQITEQGTYEIGFKSYCKDEYKDLKQGSVTYVRNASLLAKNGEKYSYAQLTYEADVREQIVTGRTQLTAAEEYIADNEYYWGKNELQACVDSIAPRIAAYEAMSQDDIIATYEEDYVKSTYSEVGYMVRDVYQEAVKYIITANKKFVEVNETLNSIQPVIDNAEKTLALRLYDAATGKDDLQAAIASAKELQMQMRAADYCAENAAIIARAIQTLNAAVEIFKTTVPASAKQTLVDIDFEQDAVENWETGNYSIAGAAGAMEFTHFATDGTPEGDSPYEQGFWENGEQKWKGFLHVGNGTGTVTFDPTVDGSMGSNILKVSCDFYITGLSNRYIGFTLKNEEDETLAGLRRKYYNAIDVENTFNVDMGKVWAKSGGTYNNASPADAEEPSANPLQKTHFEVIMDYGTMTMYCTITSPNGSTTSEPVEFSGVPTQFVLDCNYDNQFSIRRCWFDNLKIEKYLAGGAVIVDDTWTVAGAEALCGVSWDPAETSNNMTTKDGVNYTLAKDSVVLEAGVSYQYKVVANHSWDECYPYDDNASFTVEENGLYSVRFYFNSEYKTLSVEYWKTGETVIPEKTWTIAGVQALMGSAWMNDDSNNDMTALGDGAFQLVKKNVELMADVEYEFKVLANHSWSENYGMNGEAGGRNCFFTVDEDGVYDVTFVWIYDTKELYAFAECASGNVDTNYMYANDGQVLQKGTTSQLAISMLNDESVLAFQFDVVLPDGLSLAYTLDDDFEEVPVLKYTNRGLSSHVIAAEYQYDGSLRIAGYSSKNAAYRYNDGELLTFGINVEDWVADGNYTVTLKNVLITNAEGVENHASDRTFTVKVGGLKGDANNDSQVTMSDVVAVANNVLGRPSLNFNFNNADVNSDGEISIGDVVGVVNIVLGRTVAGSRGAESTSALVPGTLTLKAEADRMSVKLDNTAAYTAFQMDVTLPEGMSLNDAVFTGRQTSSHSLLMSELENGKVRIAGWSVRNDELKGNSGELLSLVLAGAQTVGAVTIDNIRFVTAEGVEHAFACVEAFGETTGIGLTPALSEGEGVVYDLGGRKINTQLKKGLYILDGKKSVKK